MINKQIISDLTNNQNLTIFADYIISKRQGRNFPDYQDIELMDIHRCVPNIWVYDLREESSHDTLLTLFSGTNIDEHYGQNISGMTMTTIPGSILAGRARDHLRKAIALKKISYMKRTRVSEDEFGITQHYYAESLMFPCSSDNIHINFAVGAAYYYTEPFDTEDVFLHL